MSLLGKVQLIAGATDNETVLIVTLEDFTNCGLSERLTKNLKHHLGKGERTLYAMLYYLLFITSIYLLFLMYRINTSVKMFHFV